MKELLKAAQELKAKTKETEIQFEIYVGSNSHDIFSSEEDAKLMVEDIKSQDPEYFEKTKKKVYYKPIVVDMYDGSLVTEANWEEHNKKVDSSNDELNQ
jgi:hypothetical protein